MPRSRCLGKGRQRRQHGHDQQHQPNQTAHRSTPGRIATRIKTGMDRDGKCHPCPLPDITNSDGANSGGASAGDASPNACGANPSAAGANPNDGGASPSDDGPSRDGGRGPSALLPA